MHISRRHLPCALTDVSLDVRGNSLSTTFSFNFLHAVTFLHVLHLDILRRQIDIETESKN